MDKRTQRYQDYEEDNLIKKSRTLKNKYLYDEINNKIGYEEIVNLDSHAKIDLSNLSNYNNREDYQKIKDYKMFSKDTKLEEKANNEVKPKEYDLNVVLEDAKRNREKIDELEKKRKLKENNYVKLADVSKEEVETYSKKDIDEEELTNLINTITSHSLLKEIQEAESGKKEEPEILSDLLATNVNQKITEGIAEEFTKNNVSKIDNSFYTKSMDLSEHDFELSDEIEKEGSSKAVIIFIVIILLIIIGVITFIFLRNKGIIKI